MTEAEWLVATDPMPLLEFVEDKASDRQLRLFCCCCCRLLWDRFEHDSQRVAVEVAERFADGGATADAVREARKAAEEANRSTRWSEVRFACGMAIRCALDRSRMRGLSLA